jgi:GDP-mannose 6-dehydrogenase
MTMVAHLRAVSAPLRVAGPSPRRDPIPGASAATQHSLSVIGLGYVGAVSVACFASLGFTVVGVDTSEAKVADIAAGRTPIVENELGELLADGVAKGLITATADVADAVGRTSVTLLSVGTPTAKDGSADLSQLRDASRAVGAAIAGKTEFHSIILRCSVPPGTTLDVVVPELERASGKRVGVGFGVAFVPEFLREGVAVADFRAPPKTVIGATDPDSQAIARAIFATISEAVLETTIEVAETVKYVDNVWHATKVVFANEVGRLCQSLGIDSHTVMDLFVKDTKLNLSSYYMKPGFAFGGSCLPKEVRAVSRIASERHLSLPLIDSLLVSNRAQINEALERLEAFAGQRIGLLGLTFKPATDDVRESPLIELLADLIERDFEVVAYDPNVKAGPGLTSQLATFRQLQPWRAATLARLPQVLRPSLRDVMSVSDVLVVGHATPAFRDAIGSRTARQHVLDLARLYPRPPVDKSYQGIAW